MWIYAIIYTKEKTGPFPFKQPPLHAHSTAPRIAQISYSPSPSPTNPASSIKTMLFLAKTQGGSSLLYTNTYRGLAHFRLACCCPPCAALESGTILPVSQLVAVATQPTLLPGRYRWKKKRGLEKKMEDGELDLTRRLHDIQKTCPVCYVYEYCQL